ncbi:hypothetical protein AB0N38_33170 [Micromonospora aurantiaca]|uniref:hypothetical protein n=1 Tax=Micromonospora aurantiaca (nom. illeg.) TaxID=47850 RepID=UPI00342BB946
MRRTPEPGLTMVTLDELQGQLGAWVNDDALRKWSTRHGMARVHLDGQWWYHLEAAVEIDFTTEGRGRPRGGTGRRAA